MVALRMQIWEHVIAMRVPSHLAVMTVTSDLFQASRRESHYFRDISYHTVGSQLTTPLQYCLRVLSAPLRGNYGRKERSNPNDASQVDAPEAHMMRLEENQQHTSTPCESALSTKQVHWNESMLRLILIPLTAQITNFRITMKICTTH